MTNQTTNTKQTLPLSDQSYDRLNAIVKYLLPASGTLYFTLGQIWNFPYGEEVVGSIAALTTFLGILLYISKRSYDNQPYPFDGAVVVSHGGELGTQMHLESNIEIEELEKRDAIVLEVRDQDRP